MSSNYNNRVGGKFFLGGYDNSYCTDDFFNVTLSDNTYYWQVTADCATIGNVNLLSSVTDEMIIDSGSTCVCKFWNYTNHTHSLSYL